MRFANVLFAVLVVGASVSCNRGDESNPSFEAPARDARYAVPIDGAPQLGEPSALVTVVAFVDYECPYCAKLMKTMNVLRTVYGDRLRVVVENRPLPIHEHARAAALAALAAGAQGAYFRMSQALLDHQAHLDDAGIETIARDIGLDVDRFRADLRGPRASEALAKSERLADSLAVKGTPTLFVNGRKISGARPLDELRRTIDGELADASAVVQGGVRPNDVYAAITKDGIQPGSERALREAARSNEPAPRGCDAECNGAAHAPAAEVVADVGPGTLPLRGGDRAPVTIVVFSDFECPYCAKLEGRLDELRAKNPSVVRLAFRNMPLPMHEHARLAAKAALAAARQGKFWEYHDALFAHQDALTASDLEMRAREVGLDVLRFGRDLDDSALEAQLDADTAEAKRLDVRGTPTAFVNGERIDGAQTLATLQAAVDRAAGAR